jgi:site-specific DNA-methyltransferase (adenine-specific)
MNQLYLGDCLNVLRDYIKDESVDLIYIDSPFNSKRNYNIFFDDKEMQTQRVAFEDTWSYKNISDSLSELQTVKNEPLHTLLNAYKLVAPQVFPYLVMMTLRILELHRVLKPTGSFYLHCDPTASHYLKTICDVIFGTNQFKIEDGLEKLKNFKNYTILFCFIPKIKIIFLMFFIPNTLKNH